MEDYKNYKQIFSMRLAGYLMMNGVRIRRIHHDLKGTNRDIYLFDNSDVIETLIIKYSNEKSTKENKNVTNKGSRNKTN